MHAGTVHTRGLSHTIKDVNRRSASWKPTTNAIWPRMRVEWLAAKLASELYDRKPKTTGLLKNDWMPNGGHALRYVKIYGEYIRRFGSSKPGGTHTQYRCRTP